MLDFFAIWEIYACNYYNPIQHIINYVYSTELYILTTVEAVILNVVSKNETFVQEW